MPASGRGGLSRWVKGLGFRVDDNLHQGHEHQGVAFFRCVRTVIGFSVNACTLPCVTAYISTAADTMTHGA